MRCWRNLAIAGLGLLISCLAKGSFGAEADLLPPEQIEFFETKVRPVLAEHCFECHSTKAKKLKAELYLDNRGRALQGGETGPVIVSGDPDNSVLIRAIRYTEESLEMPPNGKLPDSTIADLEEWVRMGAPWPEDRDAVVADDTQGYDWEKFRREHWAFRPVHEPELPSVADKQWPLNPIDQFVLTKLESAAMRPSSRADKRILIRRAYFDLIGIPPPPEHVENFLKDRITWREVIDALLASPHYGERWGRHWLDVARYSDGMGGFLDNAALPQAWRYRDWVVSALNEDLPYDEFVRRQIAGDLLVDPKQTAVATGFFVVGPTYHDDGGDPESKAQALAETLSDRVDTFSRAFLGLTVACARCHDHKFDPVTVQDYYAIAGIFKNTGLREFPLASEEVVKTYKDHQKAISDFQSNIRKLDSEAKKEKRELTDVEKEDKEKLKVELDALKKSAPQKYAFAHALFQTGTVDMNVAIRGDLRKKGPIARRRFLQIVTGEDAEAFDPSRARVDLADAVVHSSNPLTARVIVNRVWQWHFGQALVRTPSNFGMLGEKPTHPQLLEWLAATFIENDWSLKQLHRLIMMSETYRMSSAQDAENFALDGDNRLLWRMNPRRLEVESWRDSLLAVSGGLRLRIGGAPDNEILESDRRTVYSTISRNGDRFSSDEFLRTFDFPAARSSSAGRTTSTVAQQYLFMMNSEFMNRCAKRFANRVVESTTSAAERIALAYQLLFQRHPDEFEMKSGIAYLSQTENYAEPFELYAQSLLSSEEFRYVE